MSAPHALRPVARVAAVLIVLFCSRAIRPIAPHAQTDSLLLISTAWPPFTNEAPKPRFALDLVEAALKRVQMAAKTTIVPAPEFTRSLLSGRFDGSGAVWKDPERERMLIFSQPYLQNRLVLIGRRGTDVSATTLTALKGKRVAIVEGYSYGDTIDQSGAVWVRTQSEEDSVAQLLKSAVDYTLMDELVVNYMVSNYPAESGAKLQIGTIPLVTRDLHFALRRARPGAEGLINRFNAQLRGMITDRTYHQLLHVDWISADVDGNGVPEYVPATDRTGPAPPQHAYTLFTTPATTARPSQPAFYVGGKVYSDWASVPQNYKLSNSDAPDPRRSTASIFTFTW